MTAGPQAPGVVHGVQRLGKQAVGEGVVHEKLGNREDVRVARVPRPVPLEGPEIVRVAQFRAQRLEDLPVVLPPLAPQLAVHESHQVRDDAVVVEERVVDVEERDDRVHARIIRYPDQMRAVIFDLDGTLVDTGTLEPCPGVERKVRSMRSCQMLPAFALLLLVSHPATAQSSRQQAPASPFLGSVPKGTVTAEPLPLSVKDAVQRALQNNLGLLLQEESETSARGARWRALADLLPNVSGSLGEPAAGHQPRGLRLPRQAVDRRTVQRPRRAGVSVPAGDRPVRAERCARLGAEPPGREVRRQEPRAISWCWSR